MPMKGLGRDHYVNCKLSGELQSKDRPLEEACLGQKWLYPCTISSLTQLVGSHPSKNMVLAR